MVRLDAPSAFDLDFCDMAPAVLARRSSAPPRPPLRRTRVYIRVALVGATAIVAVGAVLVKAQCFTAIPAPPAVSQSDGVFVDSAAATRSRRLGSDRLRFRPAMAALSSGSFAPSDRHSRHPSPPNSSEAMNVQAAEAVMRAYRDGFTRQTVRLRTVSSASDNLVGGSARALLKANLPMVNDFAAQLWDGRDLKQVKTSIIDGEVTTLVYREAEEAQQDAAVLFLPGRDIVIEDKVRAFFDSMGDRLVVLANPEQAPANWKVENRGRDFYLVSDVDSGAEVAEMFKEQSYYCYTCPLNNWQVTFFRTYPFPWEVYIESLDYALVKVGEWEERPDYDAVVVAMERYEEANNIGVAQKLGKSLKDAAGDMPALAMVAASQRRANQGAAGDIPALER